MGRKGWAMIGVGRRETCRLPINDPLSRPRVTCRVDGHEADNRCKRRFRLNEPPLPGRDAATANQAVPTPRPTSVARR